MFGQRTSVAWPLSLPAKGLHLSRGLVQHPRGSFPAGQGNTAQLPGFIRTCPSRPRSAGKARQRLAMAATQTDAPSCCRPCSLPNSTEPSASRPPDSFGGSSESNQAGRLTKGLEST